MVRQTRVLVPLLAVLAGSADAVSVLGYGLFTAHVTGNLALLGVHLATGEPASVALLLSIPVFVVAVALTRLLANRLAAAGRPAARPLLLAQFLLSAGFLALGVRGGLVTDPHPASGTVAVLLAVSALAVQNALLQIALVGTPSTTVMTGNLTRLAMDGTDLVTRPDRAAVDRARHRAARTGPVLVGFVGGAALGAVCFALVGLWSAALLPALALLAVLIGPDIDPGR